MRKLHLAIVGMAVTFGMVAALAGASLGLPPSGGIADDGPLVLQMHYRSDPTVSPIPPDADLCSRAPFAGNLSVEGRLVTFNTRTGDGALVNVHENHVVGYARACFLVTDFSFTPFSTTVPIYWELTVDSLGDFAADGHCLPSSNDVPTTGLVLGGCVMRITSAPEGLSGNLVESAVAFNPFGIPGFDLSRSIFTLQLYSD